MERTAREAPPRRVDERTLNNNEPTMPVVHIHGWRYGLKTITMMDILRRHASLGLKHAKQIVEKVLNDESVDVEVDNEDIARSLVGDLVLIGANASVK